MQIDLILMSFGVAVEDEVIAHHMTSSTHKAYTEFRESILYFCFFRLF